MVLASHMAEKANMASNEDFTSKESNFVMRTAGIDRCITLSNYNFLILQSRWNCLHLGDGQCSRIQWVWKIFKGSADMDPPKLAYSTTHCIGAGIQLSQVFDPKACSYLEQCWLTLCDVYHDNRTNLIIVQSCTYLVALMLNCRKSFLLMLIMTGWRQFSASMEKLCMSGTVNILNQLFSKLIFVVLNWCYI